ncbi:MAG: hypothetical protein WC323_03235 [Patescibacteria group bacterium]
MRAFRADMIVANYLEWATQYAYIITENNCRKVIRKDLPEELYKNTR